jgi:hypothetical protein
MTAIRDLATQLAPSDPERAAELARTIDSPWDRCQALAWAARFAPEERVEVLAEEALYAGYMAQDRFQTVGASAWPLRALIERGRTAAAMRALADVLSLASEIELASSRAEALFLVWQAIFPLGVESRDKVLDHLLTICPPGNSWRAGRVFQEVAWMLAADDRATAQRVIAALPEGRWKRQAKRRVEAGEPMPARPFFWAAA